MTDQAQLMRRLWPGIGAMIVILVALLCFDYVARQDWLSQWATFCGALSAIFLGVASVELTTAKMWPQPVSRRHFLLAIFLAVAVACWAMALTGFFKSLTSTPLNHLPLLNPVDLTVMLAWGFTLLAMSIVRNAVAAPKSDKIVWPYFLAGATVDIASLAAALIIAKRNTPLYVDNSYVVLGVGLMFFAVLVIVSRKWLVSKSNHKAMTHSPAQNESASL